jgi:crossover junction endodeoxyribonuclease RusA
MHGPLRVTLHIHPPDNRKRDIDNVIKIILDSLQCARVYVDDHQVQELHVYRIADRGNYVTVDIVELE